MLYDLFAGLEKAPAPQNDSIGKLKERLDFKIDIEYQRFIEMHNGASGRIGKNSYLEIWCIEEIIQFNPYYTAELDDGLSQNLFLFGSNGADAAYGIKKSTGDFVEVPYLSMDENDLIYCGKSFKEFIEKLSQVDNRMLRLLKHLYNFVHI